MRQRRLSPVLLAAALALGSLTGCGGKGAPMPVLADYRADVARRVRIARVLVEVSLGLLEEALDGKAVSP